MLQQVLAVVGGFGTWGLTWGGWLEVPGVHPAIRPSALLLL
jgi:hypothetical protein